MGNYVTATPGEFRDRGQYRYVLVERHQYRVRGQGDGDAPLLAAGQLSRVGLGLRSQTDLVQQVSRVLYGSGRRPRRETVAAFGLRGFLG